MMMRSRAAILARAAVRQPYILPRGPLSLAVTRGFSSEPSPKQKLPPSIYDGFPGLSSFATRVQDRITRFEFDNAHGVFHPDMGMLKRYMLFARLQMPTQTEVNVEDFLDGSKHAVDLAMHIMFSREVAQFAFGEIAESPAATKLRQIMSPMCYDMFFQGLVGMKGSLHGVQSVELQSLDIHSVHLDDVAWEKLTIAEVKQQEIDDINSTHNLIKARVALEQMASNPTQPPNHPLLLELPGLSDPNQIVIEDADHETFIERLRINVVSFTTESTLITKTDGTQEASTRDTSAIWRFESNVTTPEDVDWRILTFMEVSRDK